MLDRYAARGLKPVVATELEFYLYKPREDMNDAPIPPDRSPTAQNFDLDVLDRTQAILDDILDAGIAIGQLLVEYHHHLPGVTIARTERSIARLNEAGYRIFHVSESGHELSFMACE